MNVQNPNQHPDPNAHTNTNANSNQPTSGYNRANINSNADPNRN